MGGRRRRGPRKGLSASQRSWEGRHFHQAALFFQTQVQPQSKHDCVTYDAKRSRAAVSASLVMFTWFQAAPAVEATAGKMRCCRELTKGLS